MYAINVFFGPSGHPMTFLFRTQEKADDAAKTIAKAESETAGVRATSFVGEAVGRFTITDDFGRRGSFVAPKLHGWTIEDLEQSSKAQIEMMLHQTRTQARAQSIAQSDPSLRMNSNGMGGIGMGMPGFPGGRPG